MGPWLWSSSQRFEFESCFSVHFYSVKLFKNNKKEMWDWCDYFKGTILETTGLLWAIASWRTAPPHARLQFKFQNQENKLDWTSGLLECASMSKSVRRASVNLTPRKPHLVDHFSGRCRTCRMDAGEEGGAATSHRWTFGPCWRWLVGPLFRLFSILFNQRRNF